MKWLDEPEEHDYNAAADYLSLFVTQAKAEKTAAALRDALVTTRKAKDILRASRLDLLPVTNSHVAKDVEKRALSPVLLVRIDNRLEIADGYHRVCAVYHLDEDDEVHCKLTSVAY